MSRPLELLPLPHRVLEGPIDVGTEQRWRIELADGTRALVGQLAPDLARDEPIRRRYVRDTERLRDLQVHSLAPTLRIGPEPDPRDPNAIAPWRLRVDPPGEPLSRWLERAPAPLDEIAMVFAAVADAVHAVHATGTVLRDLRPEQIVQTDAGGRIVLTDVGLARVDVLSSHTASSLLLQGSTYCAPEQLMRTTVDQRSDVWALGVMMWQALTGELPFGDGPAIMHERRELPPLGSVRADVPASVDALVRACLREQPGERPASATEIAWVLRGRGGTTALERASTTCQHCGQPLRVGQRLCLWCGRVAVRFVHAPAHEAGYALDLLGLSEEAAPLAWLQDFIASTAHAPSRTEFVIGSIHMYSEEERARRIRLPARLYGDLTRETAEQLYEITRAHGLRTRVVTPHQVRTSTAATVSTLVAVAAGSILLHLAGFPLWWVLVPGLLAVFVLLIDLSNKLSNRRTPAEFRLRPLPAALPASDPLVARLATLLGGDPPGDVREVVAELALVVQRLVDHRASFIGDTRELDALTAPIEPLVTAVEELVGRLRTIGTELRELDEGALVRAIAASEARGEPHAARRDRLLGLDRLRALEDLRAAAFHRLLEARSLLERTVELGLGIVDPMREQERQVALALATLTGA